MNPTPTLIPNAPRATTLRGDVAFASCRWWWQA
jgi:hypothetical protein